MNERQPRVFVRSAERRLRNASGIHHRAIGQPHDDALLDMADVAMLVWSAGIDLLSALMLLDGETRLGPSTRRRQFVRERLHPSYPHLDLMVRWTGLARLHNFQHNLYMPRAQFELACRRSSRLIDELNRLLPPELRLSPDAYAWLAEVV